MKYVSLLEDEPSDDLFVAVRFPPRIHFSKCGAKRVAPTGSLQIGQCVISTPPLRIGSKCKLQYH